jgi:hypothetical protein
MDIIIPLLVGAAHAAELSGDSVAWLLKAADNGIGFFADDDPDDWYGILMSGLSGLATALAVAIVLIVYFRIRFRSRPDIVRHGLDIVSYSLAGLLVLGLVIFVASDMRQASLAFLGINPTNPTIEFEIRLPRGTVSSVADTQVELHTDRNQTLARMEDRLSPEADGRSLLRGSLRLDYRTKERVLILNLPGGARCQFKLRLAASPSRSEQFGPWHIADHVAFPSGGEEDDGLQNDAFAIRYRVL